MTDSEMLWQCEACDETKHGEPHYTESYAGHEEAVVLWFCENCANPVGK